MMQKTKCPASMKHTRHMQVQAAEIECLFISLSNFRPHLSNFGCEHPATCYYVCLLRKCTCLLSNCQHTQNILGMKIVSGYFDTCMQLKGPVEIRQKTLVVCVYVSKYSVHPIAAQNIFNITLQSCLYKKTESNSRKQERKNLAWIAWGSSIIFTPCLYFVVLKIQHVWMISKERWKISQEQFLEFLLKIPIEQKHSVLLVLLN